MHPQETSVSARRAFLGHLIDDAGLFPPASLALPEALAADDEARSGTEAWMLRRFIVPASSFWDLVALRGGAGEPLRVTAIVDGAHVARDLAILLDATKAEEEVATVEAIELKLPARHDGDVRESIMQIVADIDASGLPRSAPAYLEFSFGTDWKAHLTATFDALADARARSAHTIAAKMRCGGPTAAAVPMVDQVAFAIGTLRALGVPFKATAGLHHPVRHRDHHAGHTVHGFLNVIGVAILDYELDFDERTRHHVLTEEDPSAFRLDDEAFAWRDMCVSGTQVTAARRDFVHSFGSCSFAEPVADLRALGVIS